MTKTEDENDKVEEFLKKTPIFPCFLISKDEGKIETIFDGFEKENIPIQKIQENSFIVTYCCSVCSIYFPPGVRYLLSTNILTCF